MNNKKLKDTLYEIIFESDTPAGKGFDLLLIISILMSVVVVLLDSVNYYNSQYVNVLYVLEWFFYIFLFTFSMVDNKQLARSSANCGL